MTRQQAVDAGLRQRLAGDPFQFPADGPSGQQLPGKGLDL
jgi:hypothetical protein